MTQHDAILDYIDRFGSITPMEAFSDLGITKLSTRISELIRGGTDIKKEPVKTVTRLGKATTFMRYSRGDKMGMAEQIMSLCDESETLLRNLYLICDTQDDKYTPDEDINAGIKDEVKRGEYVKQLEDLINEIKEAINEC